MLSAVDQRDLCFPRRGAAPDGQGPASRQSHLPMEEWHRRALCLGVIIARQMSSAHGATLARYTFNETSGTTIRVSDGDSS
jgi:hypothetical protein